MTEEDIARIQETIVKTVNGKIDAISRKQDEQIALNVEHNEKHEADMKEVRGHMEQVRPYLEGVRGIKLLGDTGKWIVGLGVVWLAFKGLFPQ